jgi:hypothetical protein
MGRKRKSTSEALRKIRPAKTQLRMALNKAKRKKFTMAQMFNKYQIKPSKKRGMVTIRSKSGRVGDIPEGMRISRAVKEGWSMARM